VVGVDTVELEELDDVLLDTLELTVVDEVVVVGVDTLELDELDDVLLDTLELTVVDEVVVVGVDTLELEEVEVELLELTLEVDEVEVLFVKETKKEKFKWRKGRETNLRTMLKMLIIVGVRARASLNL